LGTGLGPITAPDAEAPPVGDLPFPVEIFVGGRRIEKKLYSGRSPCCSSIDQVIFEVPADAPSGCYVPVLLRVGSRAGNVVTMAIHPEGRPCSDPDNPFLPAFLRGGRLGAVLLFRYALHLDTSVFRPSRFAFETAQAYFRQEAGGELAFNPYFSLPPAGACTAYASSGNLLRGVRFPFANPTPGLDAGTLSVSGSAGARPLATTTFGAGTYYNPTLVGAAATIPSAPESPVFYVPGTLQVRGGGGRAVGPVQASLPIEAPIEWTNRDRLTSIDRSQGVRFDWTPNSRGRVVVAGVGVDIPTNASAMFLCVAPAGASSFQVPAEMLANIPPGRPLRQHSVGMLILGSLPAGLPSPFTASGLDFGAVLYRSLVMKTVRFQ